MSTIFKLSKDDTRILVEHILHQSMISSRLYLTINRSDISFGVGVC